MVTLPVRPSAESVSSAGVSVSVLILAMMVMNAVSALPSLAATTRACPGQRPRTTPVPLTVTSVASSVLQVMVLPVRSVPAALRVTAERGSESPVSTLPPAGVMITLATAVGPGPAGSPQPRHAAPAGPPTTNAHPGAAGGGAGGGRGP